MERADYVLAVAVHSIEKGLGYKDIKEGFGEAKARRIRILVKPNLKKSNKLKCKKMHT